LINNKGEVTNYFPPAKDISDTRAVIEKMLLE